jgi:uncharacterized damage-inducible protein DinB
MTYISDQIKYNQWANDRLIRTTIDIKGEYFTKTIASSFNSIQETWIHIIWAEELWYERWNGRSVFPEYSTDDFPNVEIIRNKIKELSANQIRFLQDLKPGDEEKKISYKNGQGEEWTYSLRQMVQHMVFHSIYHRGQIVTLLRQLGVKPPGLDYLVYVDETSGEKGK